MPNILRNKLFLVMLGTSMYLLGINAFVYAMTVSPSNSEIFIGAGGKYAGEFVVDNNDTIPLGVKIFADKWEIKKDADATPWVKIDPGEISVPPRSSKTIKYTVMVPRKARGEYTTSMVFRSMSPVIASESVTAVMQMRVAMYVIIKGTEKIRCEVSDIEALSTTPLKMSVRLKNSGNVHVRPKGKLDIVKVTSIGSGSSEDKITTLDLNPINGPVFAGGEGDIAPKIHNVNLRPGDYKARVNVEIGPGLTLKKEESFSVTEK